MIVIVQCPLLERIGVQSSEPPWMQQFHHVPVLVNGEVQISEHHVRKQSGAPSGMRDPNRCGEVQAWYSFDWADEGEVIRRHCEDAVDGGATSAAKWSAIPYR